MAETTNLRKLTNKIRKYWAVLILTLVLLCAGVVFWQSRFNFVPQLLSSTLAGMGEAYPEINKDSLDPTQQKIIEITKQEFKQQPDYRKYSEGANEAWCADFASWVYKSAGAPFANPVSGSWRIPGTFTLRDYLSNENRLRDAESYTPRAGDLVLYDNPSSFGQHVNIVLKVHDDGSITTIGGNEPDGIRVKTHRAHLGEGFVGYGTLN